MTRTLSSSLALMALFISPSVAFADRAQEMMAQYEDNVSICRAAGPQESCTLSNEAFEALTAMGYCLNDAPGEDMFTPCAGAGSDAAASTYDMIGAHFNSLSEQDRKKTQEILRDMGVYSSSIDGLYGPGTARGIETAIERFGDEMGYPLPMDSPENIKDSFKMVFEDLL